MGNCTTSKAPVLVKDFCVTTSETTMSVRDFFDAMEEPDLEKVALLIENGFDVNNDTGYMKTPLTHAVYNGNVEMVALLIFKWR